MWFEDGMFWAALGMAWMLAVAAVIIVVWNLRSKQRLQRMKLVHEERLKAIEKGVPLPEFPDLESDPAVDRGASWSGNPRSALGAGAISVMVGGGYIAAMLASDELQGIWSFGLILVALGFGLVLYFFLTRQPERR